MRGLSRPSRLLAMLATLAFAVGVASCGSNNSGGSSSGGSTAKEAGGTTPTEAKCGLANGEKASGTPIKVGALVTKIPGIDFTDITDAAARRTSTASTTTAASTGIRSTTSSRSTAPIRSRWGRWPRSSSSPTRSTSFVGNTSILDCPVNHKYYEAQRLLRDRGRRAERVLQHAEHRGAEHGAAVLEPRRGALRDRQGGREGHAGAGLAEAAGQRGGQPGSPDLRQGEGAEDDQPAGDRADLRSRRRSRRRSWRRPATAAVWCWTSRRRRA